MKSGSIRAFVCAVIGALAVAAGAGGALGADRFAARYARSDFNFTSGGALWWESYGLTNPALLSYVANPDLSFTWRGTE